MQRRTIPVACAPSDLPLQWIAPASNRDRALLDEACGGIGEPFVLEGRAASAIAPRRLTIVSWNVHAGAAALDDLLTALAAGRLTGGRPVDTFVLLLQEAARDTVAPDPAHDILQIARRRRLWTAYAPGINNGGRGRDRGVAILSSHPLADITVIELPFERQRRVALAATWAAAPGAVPLRVATAHLDVGLMVWRGGADAARRRQADALCEAIGTATRVVLGGDFNSTYEESEGALRALSRAYPDSVERRGATWRGPLGLRRQLDHIFAKTGGRPLRVGVVPDRFGSDHAPLVAELPLG